MYVYEVRNIHRYICSKGSCLCSVHIWQVSLFRIQSSQGRDYRLLIISR